MPRRPRRLRVPAHRISSRRMGFPRPALGQRMARMFLPATLSLPVPTRPQRGPMAPRLLPDSGVRPLVERPPLPPYRARRPRPGWARKPRVRFRLCRRRRPVPWVIPRRPRGVPLPAEAGPQGRRQQPARRLRVRLSASNIRRIEQTTVRGQPKALSAVRRLVRFRRPPTQRRPPPHRWRHVSRSRRRPCRHGLERLALRGARGRRVAGRHG